MAYAGTDSDHDIALRCRALTRIFKAGNSKAFAKEIKASPTRWNNIERTGLLSRDVARKIFRQYPEVSLDWLCRGKDDGMTRTQSDEFLKAFNEEVAEEMGATSKPAPAKRKRRTV